MKKDYPNIPWTRHSIGEEEYEAINQVLKSGWYSHGPEVEAFEKEICDYIGCKYAVCVANGTIALQLAYMMIKSLDYYKSKNAEISNIVLPSASTFSATASAPLALGFTVVPIDVNEETGLVDGLTISETKDLIKDLPLGHIYSPVHLMGSSVNIEDFRARGIDTILEDGCQAFGTEHNGKKIGSDSELCVFSFHMAKLITTIEGGCIVTNNKYYYDLLISLRNHGIKENYAIDKVGTNARMTSILASIGRVQLKKAEKAIAHRAVLNTIYRSCLSRIDKIRFFNPPKETTRPVTSIFAIKVPDPKSLKDYLTDNGIDTRLFFPPIEQQLKNCNIRSLYDQSNGAFYLWKTGIMLPIGNTITECEVLRVCEKIEEYYK